MMPHPSTMHAVAELRRRDLLVDAHRWRWAGPALSASPRTPFLATLWHSVISALTGTRRLAAQSPQIGIYADAPRPATT